MLQQNKLEQGTLDTYVLAIQEQLHRLHQKHLHKRQEKNDTEKRERLTAKEQKLIQDINDRTKKANRNNITRTKEYGIYFQKHPEIHWALLAHLVSRNGGWNMTDLKGDMLPRVLHPLEVRNFFKMLERCNWLIFQDAFPQLLLYAESKRQNVPFFHLLSRFHVSSFMRAVWFWFWEHRHQIIPNHLSKLITYALIVNEQNYIEQRVIQNAFYQEHVLQRFTFLLQDFLHFNQVYFPYAARQGEPLDIAGTIVENFTDVHERVRVGKKLYAILFELGSISQRIQTWALQHHHTGSRADYWPHLFAAQEELTPPFAAKYDFHLNNQHLHHHSSPIYSPPLERVWPDLHHPQAEQGDWYQGELIHSWFTIEKGQPYEMTNECIFALNKIELVIVTKQSIDLQDERTENTVGRYKTINNPP